MKKVAALRRCCFLLVVVAGCAGGGGAGGGGRAGAVVVVVVPRPPPASLVEDPRPIPLWKDPRPRDLAKALQLMFEGGEGKNGVSVEREREREGGSEGRDVQEEEEVEKKKLWSIRSKKKKPMLASKIKKSVSHPRENLESDSPLLRRQGGLVQGRAQPSGAGSAKRRGLVGEVTFVVRCVRRRRHHRRRCTVASAPAPRVDAHLELQRCTSRSGKRLKNAVTLKERGLLKSPPGAAEKKKKERNKRKNNLVEMSF